MSRPLPLDDRETCAELLELAKSLDEALRAMCQRAPGAMTPPTVELLTASADLLAEIDEGESA